MLVLFFTCSAQALLFNLRPYSTRRTFVVASLICAVRISIVSASCCHVMLDTLPEALLFFTLRFASRTEPAAAYFAQACVFGDRRMP